MICGILLGTVTEVMLLLVTHSNLRVVTVYAPLDVVRVTVERFDKDWEIHRVIATDIVQVRRKEQ